ncbi:NAD(P)/FAD-dependent oxidoreductase [Sedimentitalea todarodis]|uniref:FAD-dependent oxidoreductase n=1 Tax=Sedimentitalea todarodis TaxID=1631240 RepID=A0ABU3VDV4_9RHOB|nr:FAD-dependent oxidoreductase [Sedimentitalea todarodis]MDU9004353.1 FAD-dependent oxidoreductase [Sedimentitalea todarodis]
MVVLFHGEMREMIQGGPQNTSTQDRFDCVVIGAGIAGASVAAELAVSMHVLLLERESQPGYHTTGRSAAVYTVAYGPPVIRALTRASGTFFREPESDFLSAPLLNRRGVVFPARKDQSAAMEALHDDLGDAVAKLDAAEVLMAAPLLRDGYAVGGLFDADASDIDVHALHQHYLRRFRSEGGLLRVDAEVTAIEHDGGWTVHTSTGSTTAPIVINASGAWADEIAALAGVRRRGLMPKRRTALIVAPPPGIEPQNWPMIVDVEEQFYLKPDAGKFLISPADADLSPPCDAQPDELQVAICIDRIERAFDLTIRRIESKWAGLRSFLPDGCPLAAYETDMPGFFWLAGQGGYGIQTAPALARAAAAIVQGRAMPPDIADQGVTEVSLGSIGRGVPA